MPYLVERCWESEVILVSTLLCETQTNIIFILEFGDEENADRQYDGYLITSFLMVIFFMYVITVK